MLKAAVIGSGGAGRNILSSLAGSGLPLYLMNSTRDSRFESIFSSKTEISASIRTDPSIKRSMMETERSAYSIMKSYDIVFSVSGMGGFYGTAVPVMLVRLSKNVIPIFTMPFSIEGEKRRGRAERGLKAMESYSRWFIALENDKLLSIAPNATLDGAFRAMNLLISGIIGEIAGSFDDSSEILRAFEGRVGAGIGSGRGMNRQEKALREALGSPWLHVGGRALISVKGGNEDDFLWIKERLTEMGAEIVLASHRKIQDEKVEILILSQ